MVYDEVNDHYMKLNGCFSRYMLCLTDACFLFQRHELSSRISFSLYNISSTSKKTTPRGEHSPTTSSYYYLNIKYYYYYYYK